MTKEKALRPSAANFFQDYEEEMGEGSVINALSGGLEFAESLNAKADSGISKVERAVKRDDSSRPGAGGPTPQDQAKWETFEGVRRKAAVLLWSYLERKELDGSSLDEGMFESGICVAII